MLNWLRYNWIGLLITVAAFATLANLYVHEPKMHIHVPAATKLTPKQRAQKNWEDYWSIFEPLEDAWAHGKPEEYIYYIKDKRTNLCFAVVTTFGPKGFMASVSCDKVDHLLVNPGWKVKRRTR